MANVDRYQHKPNIILYYKQLMSIFSNVLNIYLRSIVSGNLAERLIAVDDWKIDDLSICQKKAAVGCKNK